MNEELTAILRRVFAAELSQLSWRDLGRLRGRTDAIADAVLARARQSPDWPEPATP